MIALVCLSAAAIAQKAPPSKPFERFDGCVLEPDEWTDGDSFRVRLPDSRLETFRLYFVDTTESRSRGKRSNEQAAYFGIALLRLDSDAGQNSARNVLRFSSNDLKNSRPLHMSESHNGKSKPGRFTGERLKAIRPDTYRRVVDLLAEPREQVPYDHIARLLHVSRHTIHAVERAEETSIAQQKERLLQKALRVASKSIDRVEDQVATAGITQATVAFGVATEKALLLSAADPFAAAQQHLHQHLHIERRDLSGEFNAWHKQIEAAVNVMASLPDEQQGPIKALLESLMKFGPQPLPAPTMLVADSQAQNS